MPLRVSHLVANQADIHLDFGDDGDLTITYRPALVNERTLAMLSIGDISDAEQLADMMHRFNGELCRLIVRWDLTDDSDVVIPLTPDALSELPLVLRITILTEIAKDLRVGELNGTTSKAPSPAFSPAATAAG